MASPTDPQSPLTKQHILIIDDEMAVRSTLQRYMTMMGYAFTVADSGEIALKILEGLQPDLIFLDVGMPGTDGLATLGKLHEKYEHLKVIMLADQKEIPKATMALNLGAGDFITKPVDLPSVKRMLQIHLPK